MKKFFAISCVLLLLSCAAPGVLDLQVKEYKEAQSKNQEVQAEKVLTSLSSNTESICEEGYFEKKQFSTPAGLANALLLMGKTYKERYNEFKDDPMKKKSYMEKSILNYMRATSLDNFDFYLAIDESEKEKREAYYFLYAPAKADKSEMKKGLFYNDLGARKTNADLRKKMESKGYVLMSEKMERASFKASAEARKDLEDMVVSIADWGSEYYNKKNFSEAAKIFYEVYRVQKWVDWPDTSYLYNAALSSLNAVSSLDSGDGEKAEESILRQAIGYYEELKDLGYTGIKITYHAVSKDSGKKEDFPSKERRDFAVKIGTHEQPTLSSTSSVRDSYIKNMIYLYERTQDVDAALELLAQERRRNPSDTDILLREASLYHKVGEIDKFVSNLEAALSENTLDEKTKAVACFNLGVVYAREMKDALKSKQYYKRAIQYDPLYTDAYINLSVLILSKEKKLNDKLSNLGMSRSDKRKAKKIEDQKLKVYQESLKYLEEARKLSKDENINVLKTLKNIYYQLDMNDKLSEVTKVLKSKQ